MRNRFPFLVLLVVLLFPCSAFADDVVISENDLDDVSANEFIVEDFDSNQLLLTAPLTAENEVIDYSEQLNKIYNLISTYLSSSEEITSVDEIYIDRFNGAPISIINDDVFVDGLSFLDYFFSPDIIDSYYIEGLSSNSCNLVAYVTLDGFAHELNFSFSFSNNIIDYIYLYDYTISKYYTNVPSPSYFDSFKVYIDLLIYLNLFLVLERVLYIGWDLINFGGKKHE